MTRKLGCRRASRSGGSSEAVEAAHAGKELLAAVVGVALVRNGQRKEAQAILDPVQKLFEKNKAGGWRAEWVRRWSKRSHE